MQETKLEYSILETALKRTSISKFLKTIKVLGKWRPAIKGIGFKLLQINALLYGIK
jgi:hypothetical protein